MDKLQLAKSYCCDCACRGCNLRTGCLTIGWFSVVTYGFFLIGCAKQMHTVEANKDIFEDQDIYGKLEGTTVIFLVISLVGVIVNGILLVAVHKPQFWKRFVDLKRTLLAYMIAVIIMMVTIAVAGTMNYNNIEMQKTAFIPLLSGIRFCLDVYFLVIVYRYRNEVNPRCQVPQADHDEA